VLTFLQADKFSTVTKMSRETVGHMPVFPVVHEAADVELLATVREVEVLHQRANVLLLIGHSKLDVLVVPRDRSKLVTPQLCRWS